MSNSRKMSGRQLKAKQQFGVKRKSRRQQLILARSAIGKRMKSGGGDDGNSGVPMAMPSTSSASVVEASSTELGVSISYRRLRHVIHNYMATYFVRSIKRRTIVCLHFADNHIHTNKDIIFIIEYSKV